jgi:hypothetical protein
VKTFFKTRTRLDDRIDREKGEADTWRDVCAAVDTRDRYRCRACGRTLQRCLSALPNRLERHHVVPLSLGGRDERAARLPAEYVAQVTHNLWVTGAAWCDFVSWDDRFPVDLQLVIVRVARESLDLAAYERQALAFLAECEAEVAAVRGLTKECA